MFSYVRVIVIFWIIYMYKILDLWNSVCNIPDDVTFHEKRKGGIFTIFLYFIRVSFQLLLTFNEIRVLLVGYTAFNKLPKLCPKHFPK